MLVAQVPKLYILGLYPEEMATFFLKGMIQKAVTKGLVEVHFVQLRDFATDKHHKVDDYPYGGKQGMVLKADVIYRAVTSIEHYSRYRLLCTSPKGARFSHLDVAKWSPFDGMIILSGYYEGVDERIFQLLPFEQVSLGDFILLSGESPALLIAEAMIRSIKGVLGNDLCVMQESVLSGRLEHAHYTSPRIVMDHYPVPDVVLSGNHDAIARFRLSQSIEATLFDKPSLFIDSPASLEEQAIILKKLTSTES